MESNRQSTSEDIMREIVHLQAGQCGNQIGAKVRAEGKGAEWVERRQGMGFHWSLQAEAGNPLFGR